MDPIHKPPSPAPLDGVGILPHPEPAVTIAPEAADISVPLPLEPEEAAAAVPLLFVRAYYLLAAALGITALVAHNTSFTHEPGEFFVAVQLFFVFEVIAVAFLSRYVPKFSAPLSAIVLLFMAVVNGVSIPAFLSIYPHEAVAYGFLVAAITFAITAIIAQARRLDLGTKQGTTLLIAVGACSIVLLTYFFSLSSDFWVASFVSVCTFCSLVEYFDDDIRYFNLELDDREGWRSAICAAHVVYLNFINLYLITMKLIDTYTDRDPDSDSRRRPLF